MLMQIHTCVFASDKDSINKIIRIVVSSRIAGNLYLMFMLYFSVFSTCLEMSTSY